MSRVQLTLLATVVGGLAWTPAASQTPSWRPVVRIVTSHEDEHQTRRTGTEGTSPAASAAPKVLTLSALEALAREHHPSLAIAAARLTAKQSGRVQAGLYPNPEIAYRGMEMGNLGTPGMQGAMVRQRFITGRKRQLDTRLADQEVSEWTAWSQAQQQRVRGDLRRQFYATLVAQRYLELTRELAQLSGQLATAAQQLVEAHQETRNSLLQAEIQAEESQILWHNAERQLTAQWRQLAAAAGLPQLPLTELSGDLTVDLPAYSWLQAENLVFAHQRGLVAPNARHQRATLAIQRAIKEVVPDIEVAVMVQHMYPSDSDTTSLTIGFPIPIWNQNQGRIAQTRAELIAAENDIRRIELEIRSRLADTYRHYANARQSVHRYTQRILPRARQSLDLVRNGFERGQIDYQTLNQSQQTFLRTNLAYLDSVRRLRDTASLIESQLVSGSPHSPD
ncbi:MAG: TolC family protein [Planctomycetota bacterium]|nr:TolC family protein [Planctomycetota bacterium]